MSDRAAQLQDEIAMLKEMKQQAGNDGHPEIDAAVAARQARLDTIKTGAPLGSTKQSFDSEHARSLSQDQIHDIFEFYANFGRSAVMTYQDSLDSFMFMKMCRECPGLISRELSKTELDLIFIKAKPKYERRLDFEHFLDALTAIAEHKYPDFSPADGLRLLVHHNLAPLYDIVQVEMQKTGETEVPLTGIFKKLYDVRTYTGVYAERFRTGDGRINGDTQNRPGKQFVGNTNTGTDEIIHDISTLMRPNLHGAGTMMSPANHLLLRRNGSARGRATSPTLNRMNSSSAPGSPSMNGSPRRNNGSPSASSPRGSPRRLASTGSGFEATSPKGAVQADALLAALNKAKGGDARDLINLTSTLTEQSKREDSAGSPRSGTRLKTMVSTASSVHGAPAAAPVDVAAVLSSPPALAQEQLREIFEFYSNFGRSAVMTYQETMDNFMFMKLCRECPGLLTRGVLTPTDIDLIFIKAKPKFERRLSFKNFLDALSAIAERKYPDHSPADGLRLLVAANLAPLYDIVQVEMQKTGETEVPLSGIFKKLYDVRSYTGVYAERFRTGDGRINGDTDNRPGKQFVGNTNTGTDEIIHDISTLMRPNLRSGSMMTVRSMPSGGSPRAARRSLSPRSYGDRLSASQSTLANAAQGH